MILKAILYVQQFWNSGAMLFIVNLLTKTDSTKGASNCMILEQNNLQFSSESIHEIWKPVYKISTLSFINDCQK